MSAKFKHNINVLISNMYDGQVSSSKKRGHKPPTYLKDELILWVIKQPNFSYIYLKWVGSEYATDMIPSVDRLDNSRGYSFDNIHLVTFRENYLNGHRDVKSGVIITRQKVVEQYSLEGEYIATFPSARVASESTGSCHSHIGSVCKGKRKTCGGFIWKHKYI